MTERKKLFSKEQKSLIACIHLKALPGAPFYQGSLEPVLEEAIQEAKLFEAAGVDGLIIENFNDAPFYPDSVPSETIAAMTRVVSEVQREVSLPLGVNVLRNDALAALSIAAATNTSFIRVNVLCGATLADQGIIQGKAHEVQRHKVSLGLDVQICADIQVKHASPLTALDLLQEADDCRIRGRADALIVSGVATGGAPDIHDVERLAAHTDAPIVIGSGVIPERLPVLMPHADAFIVGSVFKANGNARNAVDSERVSWFMDSYRALLS